MEGRGGEDRREGVEMGSGGIGAGGKGGSWRGVVGETEPEG